MSHIEIIEERCKGCLLCTDACPKQLIRQSTRFNKQGYKVSEFIEGGELTCIGCTACAVMCPDAAIRVFRTRKVKSK